jgi:MoaA/NifB/PqqE/SkfB family radical SAM enzyme
LRPYLDLKIANEAKLLSEIKAKKTIFTALPPRCTFEISRKCNYHCKKCCYSALVTPPGFGLRQSEWTQDEIIKTVDELFLTMRYTESTLLGEPFLYSHFDWLMGLYRKYGVYYRPTTNGSMITERALDSANGVIDWLKCSFDAAGGELYHKLYLKDGFDQVVKNLKMFSRYREQMDPYPWFRVGLVLMNSNMEHLREYAKFCKEELNVDDIEIMGLNYANMQMMDETYFERIPYATQKLVELAEYCIDNKIRLRLPWTINIPNNAPADNSGYEKYSEDARGGDIFGGQDCLDSHYVWTNDMRIMSTAADDESKISICEYFARPFLKPPSIERGEECIKVEACGSCSSYVFGNLKKQTFTEIYNNDLNQQVRAFMYKKASLPREQWPIACQKCLCIDNIYCEENNGISNVGRKWFPGDNIYETN